MIFFLLNTKEDIYFIKWVTKQLIDFHSMEKKYYGNQWGP